MAEVPADQPSVNSRASRTVPGGIPQAPSLGGSRSSAAPSAQGASRASGNSRGPSQAAGSRPSLGRARSESSLNSSIRTTGSGIPPVPPLGTTINVGGSVTGNAGGGSLGQGHVGATGMTRAQLLFSAAQDTPDSEIEQETGVIVPRDERGRKGTNDYKKNREAATASIENKFGVAKHYVSARDGKGGDGNVSENCQIQEAYVANLTKSDEFNNRLI